MQSSSFVSHAHVQESCASMRPLVISWLHSAGGLPIGTCNSGMGPATNRRRQGLASHRAQAPALFLRALSVAMPVLAYICRYSLEMKMNASRARMVGVQRERRQMAAML